jgi:hypothetical protein
MKILQIFLEKFMQIRLDKIARILKTIKTQDSNNLK